MREVEACPDCGKKFKSVGKHLGRSDCSHPKISEHQTEVLTGLLMGDATIQKSANTSVYVRMINERFLHHLDSLFPFYGNGVLVRRTAKESADMAKKNNDNVNPDEYNKLYGWRTRYSPEFNKFRGWYSDGDKTFPEDIDLTQDILKYWYCCDGYYNNNGSRDYIKISLHNERKNRGKIEQYFERVKLPIPRWSEIDENCKICWTVLESRDVLNYMGSPLPGFEYKWPEEYK